MRHAFSWITVVSLLALLVISGLGQVAYGDVPKLQDRFDQLSDSNPSDSATNTIGFTITDVSQPLGSIEFQFCINDPLPDTPCTAPTGFDATGVTLGTQTGNTGFSIAGNSTSNTIILTRSPSIPNTNPNTYELGNIVNPSTAESYYLRLYIYPTTDGSGAETQNGGVALATNNSITVNSQVPPFLKFCTGIVITNYDCSTASNYTVDLGDLSSVEPKTGTAQFVTATNAQSGFNVTVSGTTLTSGNNVIPSSTTPSPSLIGTSQFGFNLRANGNPSVGSDPSGPGIAQITSRYDTPNRFLFNDGDTLVTASTSSDNQTFTVSYLTNVSSSQAAGVYGTTLTYNCLANF